MDERDSSVAYSLTLVEGRRPQAEGGRRTPTSSTARFRPSTFSAAFTGLSAVRQIQKTLGRIPDDAFRLAVAGDHDSVHEGHQGHLAGLCLDREQRRPRRTLERGHLAQPAAVAVLAGPSHDLVL